MSRIKILIAVLCCHARIEYVQSQRETWAKEIPRGVDFRVFFGEGFHPEKQPDEVWLSVPDDYGSIFLKSLGILAWAFEQGYDFVLKCDDDVMLNSTKLPEIVRNDYIGEVQANGASNFCSGGCYGLSRKAILKLITTPLNWPYMPVISNLQQEDKWTGQILWYRGIHPTHDARFSDKASAPENWVAKWEFTPKEMVSAFTK